MNSARFSSTIHHEFIGVCDIGGKAQATGANGHTEANEVKEAGQATKEGAGMGQDPKNDTLPVSQLRLA